MTSSLFCRFYYRFIGCRYVPHTDIFFNTCIKQEIILRNKTNLGHQIIQGNIANVYAIHLNAALIGIIKPHQQLCYC